MWTRSNSISVLKFCQLQRESSRNRCKFVRWSTTGRRRHRRWTFWSYHWFHCDSMVLPAKSTAASKRWFAPHSNYLSIKNKNPCFNNWHPIIIVIRKLSCKIWSAAKVQCKLSCMSAVESRNPVINEPTGVAMISFILHETTAPPNLKNHLAAELVFARVHRPASNDDPHALGSGSHLGISFHRVSLDTLPVNMKTGQIE